MGSKIPHAGRNPPSLFSLKHMKAHSMSYPGHTFLGIIKHSTFAKKTFASLFHEAIARRKKTIKIKSRKVMAKLFQMQ